MAKLLEGARVTMAVLKRVLGARDEAIAASIMQAVGEVNRLAREAVETLRADLAELTQARATDEQRLLDELARQLASRDARLVVLEAKLAAILAPEPMPMPMSVPMSVPQRRPPPRFTLDQAAAPLPVMALPEFLPAGGGPDVTPSAARSLGAFERPFTLSCDGPFQGEDGG